MHLFAVVALSEIDFSFVDERFGKGLIGIGCLEWTERVPRTKIWLLGAVLF